ncbi:MAG: hypothetical protein K2X45_19955 [Phreatobacter sp.]|nr:hypothetical protein [Phreatobacter sp.]
MVSSFHPAKLIDALFSVDFKGAKFRAADLGLSILITAVSWYFDSWLGMALGVMGMILWWFNPIVKMSEKIRGSFVKPAGKAGKPADTVSEIDRMKQMRDEMARNAASPKA